MKKEYVGYLKIFVIIFVVAIYVFVYHNYFRLVVVSGNSMADTVSDGGVCFVNVNDINIDRYNIVLVKLNYQVAIKRIIGLPNDKILIKDGFVYVNGKRLDEYDYFTEKEGMFSAEVQLKENEYFVLGDNREISYDSRDYGAVEESEIVGVVDKILFKGF